MVADGANLLPLAGCFQKVVRMHMLRLMLMVT